MSLLSKISSKFYDLILPSKNILINCTISPKAKLYEPYGLADSTVGDGTYISANCMISMTTIEKYCSIGPALHCGWGVHPLDGVSTSPMFYSTQKQNGRTLVSVNRFEERKRILIGNDVFIGRNVIILDGVTIGDGAVIGAGAIVSKNIPPYAIAVGNPIKVVKYRFSQEIIDQLLELQWWNKDDSVLQKVANHCFDMPSFLEEMKKI